MFKFVVLSTILAVASAGYIAPIGHIAYAAAPVVEKTITYASQPVISGYSKTIIKPNLGLGLITPSETVQKQDVLAPARSVVDVQPQITVANAAPIISSAVIAAPAAPAIIAKTIETPSVAKVGEIVEKVPTAVSHQSSTIVHGKSQIVTPLVAPAVFQKTLLATGPHTYATYSGAPLTTHAFVSAPLAYAAPAGHVVKTYNAPYVQTW